MNQSTDSSQRSESNSHKINLAEAFAAFRDDPTEQLRVQIRKRRAEQIYELLSNPDSISLDQFNREIWNIESQTLLDGRDITGQLFPKRHQNNPLTPELISETRSALDSNSLELHGNYLWRSGSKVYGSRLNKFNNEEKLNHIKTVLHVLNSNSLSPLEKVEQIQTVPGFGSNWATGLVMAYHPTEFAIWNEKSRGAFEKLGYDSKDLTAFQSSVSQLREELQASDFLELDWFLYLFNQNLIQTQMLEQTLQMESGKRYWAISLGEGGRLWKQCFNDGIIAVGWDHLGDFRQYKTKDAFAETMSEHRNDGVTPIQNSHACYQFTYEMKPGDYVLAKKGRTEFQGYGIIESDYIFEPDRSEYRSIRKVRWLNNGSWILPGNPKLPVKTLTDITRYPSFMAFVLSIISQPIDENTDVDTDDEIKLLDYTIDQALKGVFLSEARFKEIHKALSRKKNVILQGPPGVGKTFIAKRLAYYLIGVKDPSKVEMIQFHQSYSYEDFIQGYRPEEGGGFQRRDGIFHQFCRKASEDKNSDYVFIIDEINRGNLSKIFGELLMLIEADKRGPEFSIPLTYATDQSERFFIPKNLHIIGMMNTADRSLSMVDYALRRRFTFIDLQSEFRAEKFSTFLADNEVESQVIDLLVNRMNQLNGKIRAENTNLGPGFEVGHSFFCPQDTEDELGIDWYHSIIRTEIAPLLREYWFDDLDQAETQISDLLK